MFFAVFQAFFSFFEVRDASFSISGRYYSYMRLIVLQHLLRVIPVIGILKDRKAFNPIPNPAEVEAVFDAPLEMFLKVPLVFLSSYLSHSCVFPSEV